ncbi:MAG: PAS domain S-box protein, partial [Magnetococcales bacterium]|nr:PAS domain S-box protein [Magnetococcales bacterium]
MYYTENLFMAGDAPGQCMYSEHDISLVILSFVVAFLASLTALDLAARIATESNIKIAKRLQMMGAIAMGLGIWSMHFVGMMAMNLPVPVLYEPFTTLISSLAAIVSAWWALQVASTNQLPFHRLVFGSILMALGVGGMHYIGMDAMRMAATLHYRTDLFVLSLIVGVVASAVALILTFRFRSEVLSSRRIIIHKYSSALIMGSGICGVHYTAMSAAIFLPTPGSPEVTNGFGTLFFSYAIGGVILTIILGYHLEMNLNNIRLRKSADSLSRAQEIAKMGNWDWYPDTGRLHFSDQIYAILGQKKPSVLNEYMQLDYYLEMTHKDDRERLQDGLDAGCNEVSASCFIRHRVHRPDGSVKVVELVGKPSFDLFGNLICLSGSLKDITELVELENKESRALQSRIAI